MNASPQPPVFETHLKDLELIHRGKVRDVYAIDAERMLIVTSDRLSEPIFTPATKAAVGEHDENVSFETIAGTIGADLAAQVRSTALALYAFAADYVRERGIIIADTKFEFGVDEAGSLVLIDEVLTPDSSRFWPASSYAPGQSPPSFDKQYVRDYLETLPWDKRAPGPRLPADVIAKTTANYREALARLTG